MRGALAREVFAHMRTDGFSFDVELLARLRRRHSGIVEFPVAWVDVPGSTFRPARHGAPAFWELARISWLMRAEERVAALPTIVPAVPAPVEPVVDL
jgi:hypothetical protein